MKKHVLLLVSLCVFNLSFGQLSGYYSIPGNFPSIESAIASLNSQGVGQGGVTFNITAGFNETFTSPNSGLITASGSADNQVIFQKSGDGPDPVITASTPGYGSMDFIICLAGADYITFDGIGVQENPVNINPLSQAEWGFALLKSSGADGSQHVVIKNCSISLNSSNPSTCAVYSGNHTFNSISQLSVTAFSGTNSHNSCTGLFVSNSYSGIYIKGYEDESPFAYYDQENEIGTNGSNTINGLGNASGTSASYGIYCSFQNGLKVANNTFTGTCSNTAGSLYVIGLGTGSNSNVDVWNNVISMNYHGTGAFYGIYNSGMGASGTSNSANFYNNSVSNNSIPNFSGNTVGYIYISTGSVTANLYNNTIEGNTAGSTSAPATGTVYYAYFSSNPVVAGTINIYQNEINRNKRVQSANGGGATYLLYNGGNGNILNEMENNIDSITISSSGTTYGLYTLFSGSVKNVHHNSVTNIFNAKGTIYTVYNGNGTGAGFFHSNKIQNITLSSVSGKLYGIYQSSGVNQYHYNNTISQLYAPQATGNPAIYGIYLSGAVKTGAYNNTVYLDASSTGASFGVTGIFASSSIEVELKNNLIVNNSTPGQLGRNVAYQRSSNVFSTYSASSNNNNFYAGQPGGINYIYYDGTNSDLTLQEFSNRVSPRDANSVTENTPFVNTYVTPYNLHIQASEPNQCESGGVVVTFPLNITSDSEGNPRFPNEGYPYNPESGIPVNAPDIGADEFGGLALDLTSPNISFIPLSNTSGTGDRVLATTITDATGVPTVGTGLPVLYWKINNAAYNAVVANWLEGNTYSFTFGAGVMLGDLVSYYIVAQDLVTPVANVGSDPVGGAGGFEANPPTCNIVPASPYTYQVVGGMAGIYPIGSGKAYATITNAIADLDTKEVTAPVIFELWDTIYSSEESFPLIINEYAGMGPGKSITFRPKEGLTVKVTGSSSGGIFAINGASNIILDGSSGGDGDSRNLILENTGNQASSYVVGLLNNGSKGAQNTTITHCVLKAGSKFSITYAVLLTANGGDYDNTVISNNEMLNAMTGIQFAGFTLGTNNNGQITGNIFGSDDNTVTLGNTGLSVSNTDGLVISGNTIKNLFTNSNPKGINIGHNTINTTISGNMISGIVFSGTSGGGGKGIDVNTGSEMSNLTISNNAVWQISGDGWNTFGTNSIAGIRLMGTTGGITLFFNTVRLTGTIYRDGAISDISAAFYAAATVSGIDARNNIFTNSINNATGVSKAFSIYSDAPATSYSKLNYNDYFSGGPEAILGYLGGQAANLAAWQAVSLQDEYSYNMDPLFVSPSDQHPTNSGLDNKGIYISSLPDDLDGVQRTNPPDMGSLEFGINPEITTLTASRISCGGATLNGTIDPNGLTVDTYFDYGQDLAYGNTVAGTPFTVTGTSPVDINADISLPPSSTFHYRARGVTSAGVTVFSNDQVLTTLPSANPVTYTLPATNIGEITATLNGTVNARCSPATVIFEYGLTTGYGNTVVATIEPLSGDTTWLLSSDITGLAVNTSYHFRCVAENETGMTYGEDLMFTTICPVLVPTITGQEECCISTTWLYSTESGMSSYSWTVSEGGQVISGEGTSTILVLWNIPGEQSLAVSYANSNGCQAAAPTMMDITVNALPEPSIAGSNIACEKTNLSVYTTQESYINYTWVSSGGTIVSGQGTYQVEINWNIPGDNIVTVNYSDSMGCSADSPTVFEVYVLPFPGNAGAVAGTSQLCAGTRSVTYSVDPIDNVISYMWSFPYGAAIVEGENTNIITVDYSSDAESGNISVYGINSCGDGQPSPPYPVEVHPVPPAPVVTMDGFYVLHSSAPEGNQWYLDGSVIEGATGQDYQVEEDGNYFTIVTLDGCPSPLSNMMEVIITGIGESGGTGFTIYPVPNNGQFTVSISSVKGDSFSLFVYNAIGTLVYETRDIQADGKYQQVVSLDNPSPGVYTVVLQGIATIITKKILVSQ